MKKMRKAKKMQLGAEPKPSVNKKTASIFIALITLVAFAGVMGTMMPSDVSAGRENDVNKWNWAYERVLHFSEYKLTGSAFSKSSPIESANTIKGGCNGTGGGGLMVYGDGSFDDLSIEPPHVKNWCYALGGPVNGNRLYGGISNDENPVLSRNERGNYFVQNWNPIDADYSPGYIDLGTTPIYRKENINGKELVVLNEYSGLPMTSGIRWIASANTYFPAETRVGDEDNHGSTLFNGGKTVSRRTIANAALEGTTKTHGGLMYCGSNGHMGYNILTGTTDGYRCYTPKGELDKNEFNYVDQIKGASYLGELYDIRRYVWSGGGNCNIEIRIGAGGERLYGTNVRQCRGLSMHEFHFYPNGTLERLDDELMFQNIQVEYKDGGIRPVPVYVHRPKLIRYTAANKPTRMVIDVNDQYNQKYFNECVKDFIKCIKYADDNSVAKYLNTYVYTEDEFNRLAAECDSDLTKAYIDKKNIDRDIICTRADYQSWLYKQEKLTGIVEKKGDIYEYTHGLFKGFMVGDDIDGTETMSHEGYQIVQGLHKVWLPIVTKLAIKPQQRYQNNTWLNACRSKENYMNDGCYMAWMGTSGCSAGNETCKFYFAFSSTADEPLQLAYWTNGHASNLSSSNFPVAFAIAGDIPDDVQVVFDEIKQKYKDMYGKDILEEKIVKENGLDDGWEVMYLFNITQYGYFNPYTINRVLMQQHQDIANQLNLLWYASPEDYRNEKEIPDDDNSPVAINGPTVFYGSFDRTRPGNFPATCVSGNDEYIVNSEHPQDLPEGDQP